MVDTQAVTTEQIYRGIAASPGIARGIVFLYGGHDESVDKRSVKPEEIPQELVRFEQALVKTREQLIEIPKRLGHALGDDKVSIFDAHLLVLDDPMLTEQVFKRLENEKLNVEFILHEVSEQYAKALSRVEDSYLRERAADVRDVVRRILRNLAGREHAGLQHLPGPRIVIAYDLSPSDTALMDRSNVVGFATDIGSRTSHTAIVARSYGIPAVVGLHDASRHISNGQEVLLDGYSGMLVINPGPNTLYEYGQIEIRQHGFDERLKGLRDEPALMRDGHRVELGANVELADEVPGALEHGAEGIGLYRTEFLFLNRPDLPGEEEQFQAYRKVVGAVKPREVIIRTVDLGGDKVLSNHQMPSEANPFLGWRAIRFCLDRPEVFKTQLRAILRASVEGNVKLMFPMICSMHEINRAYDLLAECKSELRSEGKAFDDQMQVGVMIEVPSAALTAELMAEKVDFFSIGTNDLIQYTMAVDRVNENVAQLYLPTHAAVLKLIKMVVEAAHARKRWVGVCGEMAGETLLAPLLVGLGVDKLSMAAMSLPLVKFTLRSLKLSDARALAERALQNTAAGDVLKWSEDLVRAAAPDVFEMTKPRHGAP